MNRTDLHKLVGDRFKQDKKYRESHIRIINPLPSRHIIGMHIPEIKQVAKEIAKGDNIISTIEEFSKQKDDLLYEECMIWGFIINNIKTELKERLQMVEKFVPTIDNWAVCDTFCSSTKWVEKEDKEIIWKWLDKFMTSEREFDVRFALIMYKSHYLNDKYIERVFEKIDKIDLTIINSEYLFYKEGTTGTKTEIRNIGKETYMLWNNKSNKKGVTIGESPYYVKMGTAWLMATALAKYPDKTKEYAYKSKLHKEIIKIYIRKAKESLITRNIKAI